MRMILKIAAMIAFLAIPAAAQQVEKPDSGLKEFPQSVSQIRPSYVVNVQPMLGGPNPNILFTMPQASERVWNPMAVKIASTTAWFHHKDPSDTGVSARGTSLYDIFKWVEDHSEMFEIIQVERVIVNPSSQSEATKATLWFTYVEKQYVRSVK